MLYEVCNKVGLEEQMLGRKGELLMLFHMYGNKSQRQWQWQWQAHMQSQIDQQHHRC